jgi:hypothetical protein
MMARDKLIAMVNELEAEMREHVEKDGCACYHTKYWVPKVAAIREAAEQSAEEHG